MRSAEDVLKLNWSQLCSMINSILTNYKMTADALTCTKWKRADHRKVPEIRNWV